MMRSLWAGVTGLQAHQIAMDVEGNNIANVNTAGFKYSRANFSDLLSQTAKIATAPQGDLGGKNAMQIGLGTQVSSVTKIFKQGSVQVTDKNTDLAIQGDGFFVVSPDGGSTYKYTRNGDFSFDAKGNFTEGNGYIIQGWLRDSETGVIDATTPIHDITIPPGLTTPANDTSYITLKANLNSGNTVTNKSTIYELDANHGWYDKDANGIATSPEIHNENDIADNEFNTNKEIVERGQDLGALFNANGEAFNLQTGQGVWVSYADAKTESQTITAAAGANPIDLTINGVNITGSVTTVSAIAAENNNALASYIAQLVNAQTSTTGVEVQVTGGDQLTFVNTNKSGTEASMKNIDLIVNTGSTIGLASTNVITAFKYTYSSSSSPYSPTVRDSARTFTTTEDLRNAMQVDARIYTDYLGNGWDTGAEATANKNDGVEVTVNAQGQFQVKNPAGDAFNAEDGDLIDSTATHTLAEVTSSAVVPAVAEVFTTTFGATVDADSVAFDGVGPFVLTAGNTAIQNATQFTGLYNAAAGRTWTAVDNGNGTVTFTANTAGARADITSTDFVVTSGGAGADITVVAAAPSVQGVTGVAGAPAGTLIEDVYFPVGTELGIGVANTITLSGPVTVPAGTSYTIGGVNATAPVGGVLLPTGTVLDNLTLPATSGLILPAGTVFSNTTDNVLAGTNTKTADDKNMFLSISAYTDAANDIGQNINFTTTIAALQGSLTSGTAVRTTQNIYAASLASSTDVYDSLGTKHTVRFEFTKTGYTNDGGTEWSILISVPEPGDINLGSYPENIVTGTISFNSDGSLAGYNPTNLTYTANNGSTPSQNIELKFGSLNQFDGMTSFDKTSTTTGVSQDGYPGGDLAGIRVDETGTLIGSFTNGRSFGLAQVAMAKFTNNEGLESDGGNTFIQTSNSGDPIIGQAAVGGRGFIQASSLEMSNVDLSRSLTELIVIQRGYQANSKTITTSDQMLQTLLQLKQ
ncbi:MAG: flagellar hook protein FlgE [Sulfurospirillaceae bacterium]|nr:flagellar hook protein FlgE [Sulfurospirillaceae bacterium]MDD2825296.1 flagellar hook protein FlgE [Sulfurospirillaceae bacterium]